MGRVLNLAGEPVRNAKVEVWQANAYRRYTHPNDTNPAPLDPNFVGSAVLATDPQGRYRFKTIKPAAYVPGSSMRDAGDRPAPAVCIVFNATTGVIIFRATLPATNRD